MLDLDARADSQPGGHLVRISKGRMIHNPDVIRIDLRTRWPRQGGTAVHFWRPGAEMER
jgi:hypothetical protein